MGGIFGAVGGIVGGALSAAAQVKSAKIQAKAVKAARDFLFKNLDPAVVAQQAAEQDVAQAQQRLALQGQLDPELLKQRYAAEALLSSQLENIGKGSANTIANLATQEAIAGGAGTTELKNKLIDAALTELNAGATLPPDVQAELVQAGLEKSGMVTGAASPRGVGGQLLRKEIGQNAIKLQADRQARAQALAATASQLDQSRQSMLQSLFPNLANLQGQDVKLTSGILQQSNAMMPEVGLTGRDVAELWKARVGAYATGTEKLGKIGSESALGTSTAVGDLLGKIGGYMDTVNWGKQKPGATSWGQVPLTSLAK